MFCLFYKIIVSLYKWLLSKTWWITNPLIFEGIFLSQSHPLFPSQWAHQEVLRFFPKLSPGPLCHKEINLPPSDIHECNGIIFALCFSIVTWPSCLLSFLSALILQNTWSWLFTWGDDEYPDLIQVLSHIGFSIT